MPLACLMTLTSIATATEDITVLPDGPSFRVETELFAGESVQPLARHLILFDSGVIYDLRMDDTREAAMYDPTRGRVILLDRSKGQHTVVTTTQLLHATAQLRAAIEQEGKSDAFGFAAAVTPLENPANTTEEMFEITFGDYRYQTTSQPVKNIEIALAYHRFASLAGQLNVLRRRGAPPFARMTLGQFLADAGRLPLETILEKRGGRAKDRIRSHLLVVEQLSTNDRSRINEMGRDLAASKEVPLEQFEL